MPSSIAAMRSEVVAKLGEEQRLNDPVVRAVLEAFFSDETPPGVDFLGLCERSRSHLGAGHWLPRLAFAFLAYDFARSKADDAERLATLREDITLPLLALEHGAPPGTALDLFDDYCRATDLPTLALMTMEHCLRSGRTTPYAQFVTALARFDRGVDLGKVHASAARGFYLGACRCALRALPLPGADPAALSALAKILSRGVMKSVAAGREFVAYLGEHPREPLPEQLVQAAEEMYPRLRSALMALEPYAQHPEVAGALVILRDICHEIDARGLGGAMPSPVSRHEGPSQVQSLVPWPTLVSSDLDGDGCDELLVVGRPGFAITRLRDGVLEVVARSRVPEVRGAAAVDLDADGQPEVLLATREGLQVAYIDERGVPRLILPIDSPPGRDVLGLALLPSVGGLSMSVAVFLAEDGRVGWTLIQHPGQPPRWRWSAPLPGARSLTAVRDRGGRLMVVAVGPTICTLGYDRDEEVFVEVAPRRVAPALDGGVSVERRPGEGDRLWLVRADPSACVAWEFSEGGWQDAMEIPFSAPPSGSCVTRGGDGLVAFGHGPLLRRVPLAPPHVGGGVAGPVTRGVVTAITSLAMQGSAEGCLVYADAEGVLGTLPRESFS